MTETNGKWVLMSLTKEGLKLCKRIKDEVDIPCTIMTIEKRSDGMVDKEFDNFNEMMSHAFKNYDALICVMASGIVVRSIASQIVSKTVDPAVLVLDEKGKYAVSLLSGHIGGANGISLLLEGKIGSQAVITTASDVLDKPAVDMLAKKLDLGIDDMASAKDITARILNDESIMIYGADHSRLISDDIGNVNKYDGAIVVSEKANLDIKVPFVQLIPKKIVVGIGCRKGISKDHIIESIYSMLKKYKIHEKAIFCLATIEIKANEKGLLEAAKELGVQLKIVSVDDIGEIENRFEGSAFVKKSIGVYNVSEPAGCICSDNGEKIVGKTKLSGVTVSIWRRK
ncbi:MAG: cobalt-precorrin 5A hydrolase [Bacillota bacterium]|nr:cobalt-precorrin 5A hydrolase [Bacillota bacterium]